MPGAFLTDDLPGFFDTNEFGIAATFDATSIKVIFDRAFIAQEVNGEVDIQSTEPIAFCRTSDVSSAAQGDTIVIDSTTYTITGVEDDNTGITILRLRV